MSPCQTMKSIAPGRASRGFSLRFFQIAEWRAKNHQRQARQGGLAGLCNTTHATQGFQSCALIRSDDSRAELLRTVTMLQRATGRPCVTLDHLIDTSSAKPSFDPIFQVFRGNCRGPIAPLPSS